MSRSIRFLSAGAATAALAAFALLSCARTPLGERAPTIDRGRSQCAACEMPIAEDRCCSGLVVTLAGTSSTRLYDDLGCQFEDERDNPEMTVTRRWVRDYVAGGWIDGTSAAYVMSESIKTPMSHGIVATTPGDAATQLAGESQGRVLTLTDAKAAHHERMQRLYGPSTPPAPPAAEVK